jgi:hypothetical protein
MSSRPRECNKVERKVRASRRRRDLPSLIISFILLAGGALAIELYSRRAAASDEVAKSGQAVKPGRQEGRRASSGDSSNSLKTLRLEYEGAGILIDQLHGRGARPLALASADFDEDGVPDVVGGYSAAGGGLLTFNRGNADTIHPNTPEAQRRKAEGVFTDSPFLSPGKAFELAEPPYYLGAGDFDGDGHWDVLAANRGGGFLHILRGDGGGNFGDARRLQLPGRVTALTTGDVNRPDGLTDIAVAVEGDGGASLLVFEGPGGALGARPEIISLPTAAASMTVGQLDSDPSFDLAVAAGRGLLVIQGRDRKLSLDDEARSKVQAPKVERRDFPSNLIAVTVGDFTPAPFHDLAVLVEDGDLQVLSRPSLKSGAREEAQGEREWTVETIASEASPPGTRLVGLRSSGAPVEDVLLLDPASVQLKIVEATGAAGGGASARAEGKAARKSAVMFDAGAAPAAVLPMQLDSDALKDIVVLQGDSGALAVSLTTRAAPRAAVRARATAAPQARPSKKSTQEGGPKGKPSAGTDGKTPAPSASQARDGEMLMASAPCGVSDSISVGMTVNGILGPPFNSLDCRYPLSGEYFDRYTFTGFAGQRVAIAMLSAEFDPGVVLYAPNGSVLALNDDSSDGTVARVPVGSGYIILPVTGTYTIDATTIYFDETGNYQLAVVAQNPGECTETPIRGGDLFIGALSFGSCSFPDGQRVDVYSFFAAANQQVAIYMASDDIDSFLLLQSPSGSVVSDDDGGLAVDSRIPPDSGTLILPETGIYRIYATSFGPSDFGTYELEMELGGPTVVTNTNDSGPGSLRQAILNANSMPGLNTITFSIGSGLKTINLASPLPPVADVATIDGTTQPGYAGTPIIELNGAGAGVRAAGIKLTAGGSRVRGLVINRFAYGIVITYNGGNVVDGNFLGTNAAGTAPLGNTRNGVVIFNSSNNVVGGTTAAARNLISGNLGLGVEIGRDGSFNNLVGGNFIGTDVSGNAALGNATNGILIRVGTNNVIGGPVAGARNIISGNGAPGVALGHTLPTGNLIQGNYIGTNAAGSAALGNSGAGLIIGGIDATLTLITASNNLIGGTIPAARNVISGNNGTGVEINNLGSENNFVQGNFIGTNAAGTAALGNNGVGVSVTFAPGNVIGGSAAGAGNVISGNKGVFGFGVAIGIPRGTLVGGTGVIVQGNFIGTDLGKTLRLGNSQDGAFVDAQSVVNTITDNTIAFNGRSGVYIPNSGPQPGVQIRIELNDIYANGELAIDLGERGVTGNDPLDVDVGANLLQNFPVLQTTSVTSPPPDEKASASEAATAVTVGGILESKPNTLYVVQWGFTADAQCSPTNQPQTRVLVKDKIAGLLTDSNGRVPVNITLTLPAGMTRGIIYTNAIDPLGNTSENSPCMPVNTVPSSAGTLQLNLAAYSVNEGDGSLLVSVTRTAGTVGAVSVNYTTADGTARAGQDYTPASGTLNFAAGVTSQSFSVPVANDPFDEDDETFQLALSAPAGGAVLGPQSAAAATIVDNDVITVEFEAAAYAVGEAAGIVQTKVVRAGDTTQAVSVDYATSDQTASERRDYSMTLGRLEFAPGETAKNVAVIVANDAYVEPGETFRLTLSDPSGRVLLGTRSAATVTINSDDAPGAPNPIDAPEFYVSQQYADFLNRRPDAGGLAFWKGDLEKRAAPCSAIADPGARANCVLGARTQISAAFFLSIEFQQTGYFVIRFYTEAFGRLPRMREFVTDAQEVGRNVVVGAPGWPEALEANRRSFAQRFTARPEFVSRYAAASDADFVNTLFTNAGVAAGEEAALRSALISGLAGGAETRASVLRKVADSRAVYNTQYNRAFVLMQYFGYMRRDPDDLPDTDLRGYLFWLTKMSSFTFAGEDARDENTALGRALRAQMVEAFVDSIEYRTRFAP